MQKYLHPLILILTAQNLTSLKMKTVDITNYQSKVESGNFMVTAFVLNLEELSVTAHMEASLEKMREDLTTFPYLLKTDSATVKVTADNFKSLKEYRYNPIGNGGVAQRQRQQT